MRHAREIDAVAGCGDIDGWGHVVSESPVLVEVEDDQSVSVSVMLLLNPTLDTFSRGCETLLTRCPSTWITGWNHRDA